MTRFELLKCYWNVNNKIIEIKIIFNQSWAKNIGLFIVRYATSTISPIISISIKPYILDFCKNRPLPVYFMWRIYVTYLFDTCHLFSQTRKMYFGERVAQINFKFGLNRFAYTLVCDCI